MAGVERAIELIQTTEEQEAGRLRNFLMQNLVDVRPTIPKDLISKEYLKRKKEKL